MSLKEQLPMFLHIVDHKSKNRAMIVDFIRSSEIINKYFNKVLGAICCLLDEYMKQAPKWKVAHYGTPIFSVSNYSFTHLSHTLGCIVYWYIFCMIALV